MYVSFLYYICRGIRCWMLQFNTIYMTIQEIKAATSKTSPYFFSKDTLRFFGQTLRSFKVSKQKDGRFLIKAPMLDRSSGKNIGTTKRFFNPKNNDLEL